MPAKPPSKAHGFDMRSMSLRDMQISKSEKKILAPPSQILATPLLYCNISQNIGKEVINAELMKLWDWLGANKLALNITKTKYMVFHTSN